LLNKPEETENQPRIKKNFEQLQRKNEIENQQQVLSEASAQAASTIPPERP